MNGDCLGCLRIESKLFLSILKAFLYNSLQEALVLNSDPQTLPKVVDPVLALLNLHRLE